MELKDVTIIIPTRNNVDLLKGCVDSIRSQKKYNDCKNESAADFKTQYEIADKINAPVAADSMGVANQKNMDPSTMEKMPKGK